MCFYGCKLVQTSSLLDKDKHAQNSSGKNVLPNLNKIKTILYSFIYYSALPAFLKYSLQTSIEV